MENLYCAKDVITKQLVYGNYVNRTNGCVPIIITNVWMQDNGEIEFEYHFIDKETLKKV